MQALRRKMIVVLAIAAVVLWTIILTDRTALTIDQLPAPAKAAILKAAGGAKITEIEAESSGGQPVFEAEWRDARGQQVELKVGADGKVLGREGGAPVPSR